MDFMMNLLLALLIHHTGVKINYENNLLWKTKLNPKNNNVFLVYWKWEFFFKIKNLDSFNDSLVSKWLSLVFILVARERERKNENFYFFSFVVDIVTSKILLSSWFVSIIVVVVLNPKNMKTFFCSILHSLWYFWSY